MNSAEWNLEKETNDFLAALVNETSSMDEPLGKLYFSDITLYNHWFTRHPSSTGPEAKLYELLVQL